MPIWLDQDGTPPGHIAIYTGNDDAPMANPTGFIGTRTKFSTKFAYIPFVPALRIVGTVTVPGSIPYVPRDSMRRTINLGPHGRPGVPFLYGFATVNGIIRPICGSVPIRFSASNNGDAIHWTLGVNATTVFISEGRSYPAWTGDQAIAVDIYVSDKLAA